MVRKINKSEIHVLYKNTVQEYVVTFNSKSGDQWVCLCSPRPFVMGNELSLKVVVWRFVRLTPQHHAPLLLVIVLVLLYIDFLYWRHGPRRGELIFSPYHNTLRVSLFLSCHWLQRDGPRTSPIRELFLHLDNLEPAIEFWMIFWAMRIRLCLGISLLHVSRKIKSEIAVFKMDCWIERK